MYWVMMGMKKPLCWQELCVYLVTIGDVVSPVFGSGSRD